MRTSLDTSNRRFRGKSGPTVSAVLSVQSEPELVVAGAGFASGVADFVAESLDFDAPFDDDESDDDEAADEESADGVVVDDDFDLPPRLSVL
jgi:hypothetical protein